MVFFVPMTMGRRRSLNFTIITKTRHHPILHPSLTATEFHHSKKWLFNLKLSPLHFDLDFKDGYHSDVWRRNTDCLEELKSYSPGKKGGDTNKMASTRYGRINSSVDVTEELRKSGKKLNDQCYEKIIQNLRPGKLFVDSTFAPPNGATWKRPGELEYVNNPKFVDDFSPLDATQGKLDNCWCVVAAITLTLQPQVLLKTVIPTCNRANSFEKSSYRGIFLFR